MRINDQQNDDRASRAIKRHETHKESARAKAETRARRATRAFKYAPTTLKAV